MRINRHKRHNPSPCVTRAGQFCRHERHTPLKGVTCVTLVGATSVLKVVNV